MAVDDLWEVSDSIHHWMYKVFYERFENSIQRVFINLIPFNADLHSDLIDWVLNCFEWHFRCYGRLESVNTYNEDVWVWDVTDTPKGKLQWHNCPKERRSAQEEEHPATSGTGHTGARIGQ